MSQLERFQDFVRTRHRLDMVERPGMPLHALLGLAGETGEVSELFKKAYRDGGTPDRAKVALECGDVLYYLTLLLDKMGLSLHQAMEILQMKLKRRDAHGKDATAELEACRRMITDAMR